MDPSFSTPDLDPSALWLLDPPKPEQEPPSRRPTAAARRQPRPRGRPSPTIACDSGGMTEARMCRSWRLGSTRRTCDVVAWSWRGCSSERARRQELRGKEVPASREGRRRKGTGGVTFFFSIGGGMGRRERARARSNENFGSVGRLKLQTRISDQVCNILYNRRLG